MSSSPPEVDNVDVYSSPSEVNNTDVYSSPSENSSLQGISKPKSHKTTIIVTTSIISIILIAVIIVLYFEGVFNKASPETDLPNTPNNDPIDFAHLINNKYNISMQYDNNPEGDCNSGDKWRDIDGRILKCFKHNATSDMKVKFEKLSDLPPHDYETITEWILEKIEDKICLVVLFGLYKYYLSSPGDNTTKNSENGTSVLVMSTSTTDAYDIRHTVFQDNEILVSTGELTSLQAVFSYDDIWWVPGTGTPKKFPEDTNDCNPLTVILTKTN
jgi:hypothetical protein